MNIYNYNKNNNIYSTYNNIFDMNTLNYKRNNNIYNTHYYIKKTDVGLGMDAASPTWGWAWTPPSQHEVAGDASSQPWGWAWTHPAQHEVGHGRVLVQHVITTKEKSYS